jgi:hypothetical protein
MDELKRKTTANNMFMQLGGKWCIHLYLYLLSLYYFDSGWVFIPQLHKHLTLCVIGLLPLKVISLK